MKTSTRRCDETLSGLHVFKERPYLRGARVCCICGALPNRAESRAYFAAVKQYEDAQRHAAIVRAQAMRE